MIMSLFQVSTERGALQAPDRFQSILQPDDKPDLAFVPVSWGDHRSLLEPPSVFVGATPFRARRL